MRKNLLLFFVTILVCFQIVNATSAGDYKTVASGNWSTLAIWQTYNGTRWLPATTVPSYTNGVIIISTGDSVTVSDTIYADQLVVNAGAILHVISNVLYLKNGTGTDLSVSGKLIIDAIARVDDDPVSGGSTVVYRGDTLVQNGGFQVAQTFNGANPQIILGQGFNADLTVNNIHNLTIAGSQSYNGATFMMGKIIVPGSFVMTEYRHVFIGANSNRFIDGNIILITYSNTALSFSLPLGIGTHYKPLVFNVQKNNAVQTDYTISLKTGAPPAATLPSTLDRVSTSGYVSITTDQPGSIVNSSLQLSYDSTDQVASAARLRIAESVAGAWVNLGGKSMSMPSGKITSLVNFTVLGNFALANSASTTLMLNDSVNTANLNVTDHYRLMTTGDGKLRFTLTSKNNNALALKLLDGDNATILATLNVSANAKGIVSKDGLARGAYYITVAPGNTNVIYDYSLADSLFTPAQANDGMDESKMTAIPLALNSSVTGHIGYYYKNHRDTVDWYKVITTSTGNLKLVLTSANGNASHLQLFASNGTKLLGTLTVNGNSTDSLVQAGLAANTYYVVISSLDNTEFEPYILADTLVTPHSAAWKSNSDNESLRAVDKTGITDVLLYPNPAPKQFRLLVNSQLKADGMVALVLSDANGKIIWRSAKTNISSLSSLNVDVSKLPNGIYFLQIADENKNVTTKKIVVLR